MTSLSKESIFSVKNGRKFKYALNKAGRDNNASMMFLDNLKCDVKYLIEKGEFKDALWFGFIWDDSNEGFQFWDEVEKNIKDIK